MTGSMLGDKIEDFGVGGSILHEMKNDEVHKNVHIKTTDGSIVKAHSVVLAAVSPKFKAVFEERAFGIYNLSTANVSAPMWKMLLDFLYTGFLQLPSSQVELNTLLNACEALDFLPLLTHLKSQDFDTEEETSMNQGKGDFVCDICSLEFPTQTALKSHRGHHKRHSNEEFKCEICLINCRNEKTLARHKRMHHRKLLDGEVDFDDTESVRSSKRGEDEEEYQCDICGAYSVSLKALAAHKGHHSRIKSVNNTPQPPPPPPPSSSAGEFLCIYCDKLFSTNSALGSHKRIHAGEILEAAAAATNNSSVATTNIMSSPPSGMLSCEICNVQFQSSKSLQAHRGHHARKDSNLESKESATTATAYSSKKSLSTAVADDVYACHKCTQTFHSKSSLQSHLAYHQRTGPNCPVCNQKCLNSVYLQRHMSRSHKGILPNDKLKIKAKAKAGRGIVKSKLGQLTLQKKRIKKLIKGKQTGAGFSGLQCPICAKKFELPSFLRAHLQQDHSNYKNWRDLAMKKGFKKSQLPPYWADYVDPTCKICNIKFDKAVKFAVHMKDKHKDPKPYKCIKCTEAYTSKVGMRGHAIRVHAPQWRLFQCTFCSHVTDFIVRARKHHESKHGNKEMPKLLLVNGDTDLKDENGEAAVEDSTEDSQSGEGEAAVNGKEKEEEAAGEMVEEGVEMEAIDENGAENGEKETPGEVPMQEDNRDREEEKKESIEDSK